MSDKEWTDDARRKGFGGKNSHSKEFRGKEHSENAPYRPTKGRFARPGGKPGRFESNDRTEQSENPLAQRRNEHALKMLTNRTPSLPPAGGVLMRPRRGWKRSSSSDSTDENKD